MVQPNARCLQVRVSPPADHDGDTQPMTRHFRHPELAMRVLWKTLADGSETIDFWAVAASRHELAEKVARALGYDPATEASRLPFVHDGDVAKLLTDHGFVSDQ